MSQLEDLQKSIILVGKNHEIDKEDWLIELVQSHQSSTIRRSAIVGLRHLKSTKARPLLTSILAAEFENENLRESVIKALGEIGNEETLAVLRHLLSSKPITKFETQAIQNALHQLETKLADTKKLSKPISLEYIEKIESIQNILLARATGQESFEGDYQSLRDELVQDEYIKPLLPRFVITNRSLAQFWAYIKTKFSTYRERRQFIWEEFSPLLDSLEKGTLSYADGEDLKPKPIHPVIEEPVTRQYENTENITILFWASDPTDLSRLRLGEELREIQENLQRAKLRERFNLHQRMSIRSTDISQALLDLQPQIVHFSGHGTGSSGGLFIEDKMGKAQLVDSDALASLFEQFTSQISCVVLNACYSEPQAIAIARHVPYVIGMNNVVDDKASIAFAIGFYQALGAGRTIEDAFKLGCVQIRLQGISDYSTPILIPKK